MNNCIECGSVVDWNERSSLCEDCFDKQLQNKITNEDRVVESPHASWF